MDKMSNLPPAGPLAYRLVQNLLNPSNFFPGKSVWVYLF